MTHTERVQLAEFQDRQKRINEIPGATIGDMVRLGVTFSYAGRLSSPFGAWHCPSCWMDYAAGGQYSTPNTRITHPTQVSA